MYRYVKHNTYVQSSDLLPSTSALNVYFTIYADANMLHKDSNVTISKTTCMNTKESFKDAIDGALNKLSKDDIASLKGKFIYCIATISSDSKKPEPILISATVSNVHYDNDHYVEYNYK